MNGAAAAPSVERDEPLVDERSSQVPMIVVILPDAARELSLGPTALGRLAELGITNVALLRDEETVGLVLEGEPPELAPHGRLALGLTAGRHVPDPRRSCR